MELWILGFISLLLTQYILIRRVKKISSMGEAWVQNLGKSTGDVQSMVNLFRSHLVQETGREMEALILAFRHLRDVLDVLGKRLETVESTAQASREKAWEEARKLLEMTGVQVQTQIHEGAAQAQKDLYPLFSHLSGQLIPLQERIQELAAVCYHLQKQNHPTPP